MRVNLTIYEAISYVLKMTKTYPSMAINNLHKRKIYKLLTNDVTLLSDLIAKVMRNSKNGLDCWFSSYWKMNKDLLVTGSAKIEFLKNHR